MRYSGIKTKWKTNNRNIRAQASITKAVLCRLYKLPAKHQPKEAYRPALLPLSPPSSSPPPPPPNLQVNPADCQARRVKPIYLRPNLFCEKLSLREPTLLRKRENRSLGPPLTDKNRELTQHFYKLQNIYFAFHKTVLEGPWNLTGKNDSGTMTRTLLTTLFCSSAEVHANPKEMTKIQQSIYRG